MHAFPARCFARIAVFVTTVFLAGCGGGGSGDPGVSGPGGAGTLRVLLTDAPSCGYDAVQVTVTRVSVHASSTAGDAAPGWTDVAIGPPRRVDLLTLANGVLLELGQVALPSGTYQQIRLVLADNASAPLANAVTPAGGAPVALDTPSAQQSGLKLQANVTVPPGQTMDVVIDFDACRSVVRAGNSGKYLLKPVIAVTPVVSVGSISGVATAAPAAPLPAIHVSAQVGGVVVKETRVASGTPFKLAPIASGTYDLVFTAANRTTRVVTGVPVYTAGDTVLSTPAAPIVLPAGLADGAAGGTVLPVAAQAHVRALQSIGGSVRVEVGSTNADALTGAWALALPTAPAEVASPVWPPPPISVPPPIVFAPVAGSGGLYRAEASASGYAASTSALFLVPPGGTAPPQDFVLAPAP